MTLVEGVKRHLARHGVDASKDEVDGDVADHHDGGAKVQAQCVRPLAVCMEEAFVRWSEKRRPA